MASKRRCFGAQVAQVGRRVKRTASGGAENLVGAAAACVAVYVFVQPGEERGVIAALDARYDSGIAARRGEQLRGHDVPERIGGKRTNIAGCPVHVLQHTGAVVGNLEAKMLARLLRPDRWQVPD